jgi:hypothetical protein
LAFEVLSGFLGYFSEFKTSLYALLIAILCLPGRRVAVWLIFPTLILGIALSIFWSSIKVEYRRFLNNDSRQQVVFVSTFAKIERLSDLISALTFSKLTVGINATINRLAYVDLLGKTMDYVPSSTPHENGALWGNAIRHVLVPRFINPNKESLDDSEITRRYTGLRISGRDEGTSIGLGYISESYVDFGKVWMNVPVFAVGMWIGFVYRVFINQRFFQPLGAGFLFILVAINGNTIAISAPKLLGSQTVFFIVYFPLLILISRSVLSKGLEREPETPETIN